MMPSMTRCPSALGPAPADRLTGFGVLGQGPIVHGLANLKLFGLLAGFRGDGFVHVRGHFCRIDYPTSDFKRIRREDEVQGTGFEMGAKLAKVGGA